MWGAVSAGVWGGKQILRPGSGWLGRWGAGCGSDGLPLEQDELAAEAGAHGGEDAVAAGGWAAGVDGVFKDKKD
jgi:hypothetical protein